MLNDLLSRSIWIKRNQYLKIYTIAFRFTFLSIGFLGLLIIIPANSFANLTGTIDGWVIDQITGEFVNGVLIETDDGFAYSGNEGYDGYFMLKKSSIFLQLVDHKRRI